MRKEQQARITELLKMVGDLMSMLVVDAHQDPEILAWLQATHNNVQTTLKVMASEGSKFSQKEKKEMADTAIGFVIARLFFQESRVVTKEQAEELKKQHPDEKWIFGQPEKTI